MLLHSWRAQQLVNALRWAGIMLSEDLEQFNGHARLTFKQAASQRIQVIFFVWIPDRTVSKQLAHTVERSRNVALRLQSLAAIGVEPCKTQVPQHGI